MSNLIDKMFSKVEIVTSGSSRFMGLVDNLLDRFAPKDTVAAAIVGCVGATEYSACVSYPTPCKCPSGQLSQIKRTKKCCTDSNGVKTCTYGNWVCYRCC